MSTGDTTHSHSAIVFGTFRIEKDSTDHGNKPPSKRLREEDDNPSILVSKVSTTTLIADNLDEGQNFLTTPTFAEYTKE